MANIDKLEYVAPSVEEIASLHSLTLDSFIHKSESATTDGYYHVETGNPLDFTKLS